MSNCPGKTCPISLGKIPERYEYESNKQTYNVRQLAKMVLANRQAGRTSKIPHTRNPITESQQQNILKRAGVIVQENVDARDHHGKTALIRAAQHGHLQEVQRLLAAGANVNATSNCRTTTLMFAIINGHLAIVQKLLAAQANVNATNNSGFTALMFAAEKGHLAIVQQLLDAHANVNASDHNGKTALMLATEFGHTATANILQRASHIKKRKR